MDKHIMGNVWLAGLIVPLAACTVSDTETRWTISEDTLATGARRVVNTPPPDSAPAEYVLTEDLRIGSADDGGPATFGQIKALAVAPDGRIAVLESQAQEVRIFSADGRHLATHGRKGSGPGEFKDANGMLTGADGRLWIPDPANARVSVLDWDAGFVRSFAVPFVSWGWVFDGAITADGRFIMPSFAVGAAPRRVLLVYDSTMTMPDTLPLPDAPPGDTKDLPGVFGWETGNASGFVTIPFYQRVDRVIDRIGLVWSIADDAYRIKRWRPGGDTLLVIENGRAALPVSMAERDSAIAALRADMGRFGVTKDFDWSRIPRNKPFIYALIPTDSALWVQVGIPGAARAWDVYDAAGRYQRSVTSPQQWYPWVRPIIAGDLVWGVVTDELEVPYVVRARIAASGTQK